MVDYDQNSSAQQSIIMSQEARIRSLAGRIGRAETEMRIVDYGCGPGRSAIAAVEPAILSYRANFPDGPVAVCHSDQPGNDWNALFGLVYGPSGYQAHRKGVRTEASIGSFYDPVAPRNSVDLATCFAASHWLHRAVRLYSPGSLWFADLEGDARREMADLAREDWARFLRLRARELRPGGFLFVSTLGSIPDSSEINGTASSGRGIYRALQSVAQGMADDELINGKILDHFVFSLWFQTAEEAGRPFNEDDRLREAFTVETISVTPAPDNPTDFFGRLVDNPFEYAKAYTGYIRAFADSTLRTQLFRPAAQGLENEGELASEFYRRLNDLYRTHLAEYAFELWHLTVVLQRR